MSSPYDQTGRLTQALTGAEARGEAPAPGWEPFKQNYGFNAFGNLTSRTGQHWGNNEPAFTATYANDRNTNPQWQYNADGDLLQQTNQQITRQYVYDAAGQQVSMTEPPRRPNRQSLTLTQGYDGDGGRVRYVQNNVVLYEIRSSVLGGRVITEFNAQGAKTKGWVYANGGKLARQSSNEVTRVHEAPDGSGEWRSAAGIVFRGLALDPLGDDVGVDNPYDGGDGLGDYPSHGDPADFDSGCTLEGGPIQCEILGKWFSRNRTHILARLYDSRTPSTFPSTATQITFATIFRAFIEDTPLGGLLYPKADKLWRFINPTFPPGSLYADPQKTDTPKPYTGPCPPTKEQLAANTIVKDTLDEAMKGAQARGVEHGGWIFWNKKTGKIATLIKEPTIARLNPEVSDRWDAVFLNNPPPPPNGWYIVGTFHTHPENVNEDPQDIALENSRKIPSMIRMPNGGISPYGAYDRGIWGRDLPKRCQ
jgi:YD repeat-containing protein